MCKGENISAGVGIKFGYPKENIQLPYLHVIQNDTDCIWFVRNKKHLVNFYFHLNISLGETGFCTCHFFNCIPIFSLAIDFTNKIGCRRVGRGLGGSSPPPPHCYEVLAKGKI